MRVDEARHDDAVRRVDDLCISDFERDADRSDPVVFDQNVATVEVADLRVHAQDMTSAEQHALGHDLSLLAVRLVQHG